MTAPAFPADVIQKFWVKVDRSDEGGCWLWKAATNGRKGYGVYYPRTGKTYAHRFSYVLAHGSIPDGLVIDHLCRTPACVNPSHLEPVTNRENLMRADVGPRNAAHARERAARRLAAAKAAAAPTTGDAA